MKTFQIVLPMAVLLQTTSAVAQVGVLDQSSQGATHSWNADNTTFQWQQEVQVGRAGYLEGVTIEVGGTSGCDFLFRLYLGEGPGLGEPALTQLVVKSAPDVATEFVFVDTKSARLQLEEGDYFTFAVGGDEEKDTQSCGVRGGQDNLYPAGDFWSDGKGSFISTDVVDINFQTYMVDAIEPIDAGVADAGITDAGITDAGVTDAGAPDSGVADSGTTAEDSGVEPPTTSTERSESGCSCRVSHSAPGPLAIILPLAMVGVLWGRQRRRSRSSRFYFGG